MKSLKDIPKNKTFKANEFVSRLCGIENQEALGLLFDRVGIYLNGKKIDRDKTILPSQIESFRVGQKEF